MQRNKIICPDCGRQISKSNYNKHQLGHLSNSKYSITAELDKFECTFCFKECKNKKSLVQHEIKCKNNPNRKNALVAGFNTKGSPTWNKGLTKETDERVAKNAKSLSNWYSEHPNHKLGGLHAKSCRRCKYGTYKGFYCDSGWELAFLVYTLDHNINIKRNLDCFEYIYEDKIHKYYPDFIVDNIYYEVKGRYTDKDWSKINQFPADLELVIIDSKEIYKYIKYCETTYGINYLSQLYDRNFPSWLDLKDNTKKYQFKIEK